MAKEATTGDRVCVAFQEKTGFSGILLGGGMVKYWSNINHIKRCKLNWLKSN